AAHRRRSARVPGERTASTRRPVRRPLAPFELDRTLARAVRGPTDMLGRDALARAPRRGIEEAGGPRRAASPAGAHSVTAAIREEPARDRRGRGGGGIVVVGAEVVVVIVPVVVVVVVEGRVVVVVA